jgi:hypothetical protein
MNMATSGALIDAVAHAFGVQPATPFNAMRSLRANGLVNIAGRGTGAARMTARDAVRLMIAVAAAEPLDKAHIAVASYESLACAGEPERSNLVPKNSQEQEASIPLITNPPSIFFSLKNNHTFGEALEAALISLFKGSLFPSLDLVQPAGKYGSSESPQGNHGCELFVRLYYPHKAGVITVKWGEFYEVWCYGMRVSATGYDYSDKVRQITHCAPGLVGMTEIGTEAIVYVAKSL